MPKQPYFGSEAREKLLAGVSAVAAAVGSTLGPKGSNVAIDRDFGVPLNVHDGVTVAKEFGVTDKVEQLGVSMVVDAADKTNDAAGDGTTTATLLVEAIAKQANKVIVAGANAMIIRSGIEQAKSVAITRLKDMARDVVDEEIIRVATISAQDDKIGSKIAKAIDKMGRDVIITVEESGSGDLGLEFKEGMQFDRGVVHPFMAIDPKIGEVREAEIENPIVLVTDKRITDGQELLGLLTKIKEAGIPNVFLVCGGLEAEALAIAIVNKQRGAINTVAVTLPGFDDKHRRDFAEDIAALTNSKFIPKESNIRLDTINLEDLGRARRVVASPETTLIVDGAGSEQAKAKRVDMIRAAKEKMDISPFDKERLQERLAKLTSGIAVITVSAHSDTEMREKKERIIDAISAVKAAMEEGVVPGGETALLRCVPALTKLRDECTGDVRIGVDILLEAIKKPFMKLMDNSGLDGGEMLYRVLKSEYPIGVDVMDGQLKDMMDSGIIDPVKVTRCALENAVSVGIMIATTDTVITTKEEKHEATS